MIRAMIRINDAVSIPDSELSLSFARSGGPGGQNVNKVSSKAVLRWRALETTALPFAAKARDNYCRLIFRVTQSGAWPSASRTN